MDSFDFISLAGKLAAAADAGQATYRTAVSRSYYGAFHLTKTFLDELGYVAPRTANVHVFVQRHLTGSGHSRAYIAARLLGDLHAARNRADYQLGNHTPGTQNTARWSVESAHAIDQALVECAKPPARDEILAGISNRLARSSRSPGG